MTLDQQMNKFREASRELFNHYFRVTNDLDAHDDRWLAVERFQEVEALLFSNLVAEPLSIPPMQYGYGHSVQPHIRVQIRHGDSTSIMLNREIDSGYWDFPLKEVTSEAVLLFKEFFDWDSIDFRDHRYARVQVSEWTSHPETVGKHGLIETFSARYVMHNFDGHSDE